MAIVIQVPSNYADIDPNRTVPAEGDHNAIIHQVLIESGLTVRVRYKITDGTDRSMRVDQLYNLDNDIGLRQFKQLNQTMGIHPVEGAIDIEPLVGRELIVTVAHREYENKTYANIVSHAARP
jgi:hypothetical protein